MATFSHDLLPHARTGLIGREHPSAVLRSAIERTAHSHGGLVLITGEAGVGKSSLATSAVEEARRTGVLVLSGACWDSDGVPDLWPWVQVGRALRRSADAQGAAHIDQSSWDALAVLFGEDTAQPRAGFALFDALTAILVSLARARPLLVVLEDLHWADTASLDLLEFVAQHTWFEQVLMVGTYRDAEVENEGHPLQGRLASLSGRAVTLALSGLEPSQTGALIERTAGRRPDDDTVEALHRWTGGNPFFTEQAARLWQGGGGATALAPGVREAVRRRLALLPEPVRTVLVTAALLGREFHRQVLAAASREPDARVDRLLDQAAVAKLVAHQGGGHRAFAHDLVRETLVADCTEDARRAGHLSVVHAADRSTRVAELMSPPELARHAYLAGAALTAERAVELLVRAAQDATRRLAAQEGLRYYRRALERAESLAPRPRVLVLLDYSDMLRRSGHGPHADREYERALVLASDSGEPELFARVVLEFSGTCQEGRPGRWPELVAEAHRVLLPDRPPQSGSPMTQAREIVEHLVRRAREQDDEEALTFALSSLHATVSGPGSARERLTLSREMERLARNTEDRHLVHIASALQWVALLELGDPRYLEQFRAFATRAHAEDTPLFVLLRHIDQAVVSGVLGDFDEAAAALAEAQRFSPGTEQEMVGGEHFLHLEWTLLMLQGRYAELEEPRRRAPQQRTRLLAEVQQALTAVQRGDAGTARAFLETHDDGEATPGYTAPLWWRLRAQVAAATRDQELSERARDDLAPHSGEWLVSMFGYEVGGPVDLWLGRVEAAQGRWVQALEYLRAAYASARALSSRPWTVEARLALAEALLDRAEDGDGDAALSLLDDAENEAAGMRHVPEHAARLRDRAAAGPAESGPENEFRFDSGTWSLRFAGAVVHMPDAKGLRDLHLLLSGPGVDVPAVRLVNPAGGAEAESAARMGGDDVLDERAKAEFRRRLAELDERIERAEALGDDERAAADDRERAALLEELRSAAGLAGRPRRLGDAAERARKTVTARIRDTLQRLDHRHPELAAHLRETVSTGAHCSYRPSTQTRWRL